MSPILRQSPLTFEEVRQAMQQLTGPLLLSELGRSISALDAHLGRALGGERLVVRLRADRDRFLVLDVAAAEWKERALEPAHLMRQFPCGIDVHLADLAGLLTGELQAWELCSASYRQWFIGTQAESPTAFLYAYFDEGNRADLVRRNFERHLAAG